MLRFKKLREAICMTIHWKKFKKVSIEVLRENQIHCHQMRKQYEHIEAKYKDLEERHYANVDITAKFADENRELKKKIEEYESGQERWEILDL